MEISNDLKKFLSNLLPTEKTVLELGSGEGTEWLAARWKVYSIEHDTRFIGCHNSHYIHAPIVSFYHKSFKDQTGWYSREVLEKELKHITYDLILIDGPPGNIGRGGFYTNFDLFKHTVPMVFDDVHRHDEARLCLYIAKKIGVACKMYPYERAFGYVDPNSKKI